MVGLTVPTLNNPFFGEMAETFESLARSDRKLPLITVTHYDPEEEIEMLNPRQMMNRAHQIFAGSRTAEARTHFIPHELLLPRGMSAVRAPRATG